MKRIKFFFNCLPVTLTVLILAFLWFAIPRDVWAIPCPPGCTGNFPACNCPGGGGGAPTTIPLGVDDAVLAGIIFYGAYKLKKRQ